MAAATAWPAAALVVGANQRTTSLLTRERLYLEGPSLTAFLDRLRADGIDEAMVLSTCDRVEVYAVHGDGPGAARAIVAAFADHGEMAPEDLAEALFQTAGEAAVRHVFAVSGSLESQVIGEPHVLGQMKAGHRLARDRGMMGSTLEGWLQAAYGTAKRVRSETAIGEKPVSVAAAAVDMARSVHGDLRRCSGLLIGVGEMGELIADALIAGGLNDIAVTHPRVARAEAVARILDCHVAVFDDLIRALPDADVIVTALSERERLLTAGMVKAALKARRRRPVLLVDTGVPGDVDGRVERLDGAFLFTLDDLERVALDGRASRENEAERGHAILDEEVARFLKGQAERAAVPVVSALRERFEAARRVALTDAGGDADKATRLLVNRLLHGPSEHLRAMAAAGDSGANDLARMEAALRRLFGVDESEKENE